MPDDMSRFSNYLPDAVKRQVEAAHQVAREAGMEGVPDGPEGPTPLDAPQASPTVGDAAPPAPAPEPASAPEPAPVPAAQHTDWEQRYRTLQGKYDAEVPDMRLRLQALELQNANLQRLITEQFKAPAPAAAPQAPAANPLVTDKDRDDYGELVDRAQAWARAGVQADLDALRQEITKLQGGVKQTQEMTATQRLHAALDQWGQANKVDWRTIDAGYAPICTDFHAWLKQADRYSGVTRHQLMNDAAAKGDLPRVVRFFDDFYREHTAQAAAQQPSAPVAAPEPRAPQLSLETLAAPGRPAPAASGATDPKRIWTGAMINTFYSDVAAGKYTYNDALKQRTEKEIFTAMNEGRVTP